jgi:integrase
MGVLEDYVLWLSSQRSAHTVKKHLAILKAVAKRAGKPVEELSPRDAAIAISKIKQEGRDVLAREASFVLRVFFRFKGDSGGLDLLPKIVTRTKRQAVVLAPEDIVKAVRAMLANADLRAAAMVSAGWLFALRRSEASAMDAEDIDFASRIARIKTAKRRGGVEATHTIPVERAPIPDELLSVIEKLAKAVGKGPLFRCGGDRCSPRAIQKIFRRVSKRYFGRRLRFHDLRHSRATFIARLGDPFLVKAMLRHTSLRSSMAYVHINIEDIREKLNKLWG